MTIWKRRSRVILGLVVGAGAFVVADPASAETVELESAYIAELSTIGGSAATGTVSIRSTASGLEVSLIVDGTSAGRGHPIVLHGSNDPAARCPRLSDDRDGDGFVTNGDLERVAGQSQLALTTEGDSSPSSSFALDRAPVADESGRVELRRTLPTTRALRDALGSLQIVVYGDDLNFNNRYDGQGLSVPAELRIPVACGQIRLTNIRLSDEFSSSTGVSGIVSRLYVAILDRSPETEGHAYFVDQIGRGAHPVDVVWAMAVSPEFNSRFGPRLSGTTEGWVDFVYQAVFGRRADTLGRQYWINQLNRGLLQREELLFYFADSAEFKNITSTS